MYKIKGTVECTATHAAKINSTQMQGVNIESSELIARGEVQIKNYWDFPTMEEYHQYINDLHK